MLWQEESKQEEVVISQHVVDLVFEMTCPCLPVDHAYALSQAVAQALPWFNQEAQAGLHLVHGAESSHGWSRPEEPESLLYLSRRTKLTLRLPQARREEAQKLTGMTLDIAGYPLKVGKASQKNLHPFPVLFARHLIAHPEEDEESFVHHTVQGLQALGIRCRKALCGKTFRFKLPRDEELFTRSFMVADLTPQDSVTLQQEGVGQGRKMGCGVFVPHKDIKAVKDHEG